MEIIIVSMVAFLAAMLTFFSGFGLGTLLTPVFMIFLPVEAAIAATGLVHFFNNIFKLILVGKDANREVLLQFGVPAVLAAFAGAWLLLQLPNAAPIFQYKMWGRTFDVYLVKLLISALLIVFALMDLLPFFKKLQFSREKLPIGGALSGFFGGLSGNQGALRSAFLVKAGLSKEAFVGTGVVVSTFIDFTRLTVYFARWREVGFSEHLHLLIFATLAAFSGAFLGNRWLKKVTIDTLQKFVAVGLLLLAVGLGLGWI